MTWDDLYDVAEHNLPLERLFDLWWEQRFEELLNNTWQFSKPSREHRFRKGRRKFNDRHTRRYNWLMFDGIIDWPFADGSPGRKFFKRLTSKKNRVAARHEIEAELLQMDEDAEIAEEELKQIVREFEDWQLTEAMRELDYDIRGGFYPQPFRDSWNIPTPFDPLDELYLDI